MLYSAGMEKAHPFERAFVALVAEKVAAAGMSQSEFARRVIGKESSARLWRATRMGLTKDAEPRAVSLSEAYRMAETLGEDFPTFIWEIAREAKARGLV